MPRIKDTRITEGKKNRNKAIREYYIKRWECGIRHEIIEAEIISKWGLSASTINNILKQRGEKG